jgi:ribonuclease HI
MDSELKKVTIYTDGSCINNPGVGGYGCLLMYGTHSKEIRGAYRYTTNNRMELMACIVAIEALTKPCDITLYSDSTYVVNGINKMINDGYRNKYKKNRDLWDRLVLLCDGVHRIGAKWVKAHDGNTGNEICDRLAYSATKELYLAEDKGYLKQCNN